MDPMSTIYSGKRVLAVIIRSSYKKNGLHFFTDKHMPLQVGIHRKNKGEISKAHLHKPIIQRQNINAGEIFYLKNGRVKITLYSNSKRQQKPHSAHVLSAGDIIILLCGHSVEFLKKSTLMEFKQGPYYGVKREKIFLK